VTLTTKGPRFVQIRGRLLRAVKFILVGLTVVLGGILISGAILSSVTERQVILWNGDSITYSGATAVVWRQVGLSTQGHRIELRTDAKRAEFGTSRPTLSAARTNMAWHMGSAPYLIAKAPVIDALGIRYERDSHRETFRDDMTSTFSLHALVAGVLGVALLSIGVRALRRTIRTRRRGFEIVPTA
jgi:uncharacterized membrane protein YidH (DUF202 family)